MVRWEKRFFRESIFTPGDPATEAAAPAESAFLWRALGLKKGAAVLDVCCGTGRHALRLARRGAVVTGVDATPAYLEKAERDARAAGAAVSFRRGDIAKLPAAFAGRFDAAYNVWTSFGYALDPREDLRALKSMAGTLKPGGRLLIDLLDSEWLEEHFQPQQWARRPDGAYRLEETELRGGADPAMLNTWTIVPKSGRVETVKFFLRRYDERRLRALMRRAGLTPLKRWRGLDGARTGPRLVLLARK
jgi:SAM-dependent methyltransferase